MLLQLSVVVRICDRTPNRTGHKHLGRGAIALKAVLSGRDRQVRMRAIVELS